MPAGRSVRLEAVEMLITIEPGWMSEGVVGILIEETSGAAGRTKFDPA